MKIKTSNEKDYLNFFKAEFVGIALVILIILGVYGFNKYEVWSVAIKVAFTGFVILAIFVLISRKPPLEQEKQDSYFESSDIQDNNVDEKHDEPAEIDTQEMADDELPFEQPIASHEVEITKRDIQINNNPSPTMERFESNKSLFLNKKTGTTTSSNVVDITYSNSWD